MSTVALTDRFYKGPSVKAAEIVFRRGEYADRAGNGPRLILLDLKMPRVNGIEVTRAIKADERTR